MESFKRSTFISKDSLRFNKVAGAEILLNGEVSALGNILITVEKDIEIFKRDSEILALTREYSYNVSVQSVGNVFRYGNGHLNYLHEGCLDSHCKHLYDWRSDRELPDSPIWVGVDNWPTLGDVIKEAQDWYLKNQSVLPSPDTYARIPSRGYSPPSLEL